MCKLISAEIVIGNYILDAISNSMGSRVVEKISISKLIDYDEKLSDLIGQGYFSKFNTNEIFEFQYNYPYIIRNINAGEMDLSINEGTVDSFKNRLERYFRMGLPSNIVEAMNEAFVSTIE